MFTSAIDIQIFLLDINSVTMLQRNTQNNYEQSDKNIR